MKRMEKRPGMFETSFLAIAFIVGLLAMAICMMFALTSEFVPSFLWFLGACVIFAGICRLKGHPDEW